MEGGNRSTGKRSHSKAGLSEGNNAKNKKRSFGGDTGPAGMPSENDTVYRILCPANKIGSVIGKGGDIIKLLRQETCSKIKIADSIPGVDERVIIIFSPSKKKDDAKKQEEEGDADNENDDKKPLCPAQDALLKVHLRIIEDDLEGASDEEDETTPTVTARLLVPNNQIGCLLGKGGKIIEKMRTDTCAQIRVMPKEHLPLCAMTTDELVQISGHPAVVKNALFEISARLHDNPAKNKVSFNNGPHLGSSIYGLPQVPTLDPRLNYDPAFTMPLMGGYGGLTGSAWLNSSEFPYVSSFGGPSKKDGGPGKEVIIRVLCPNERVGGVIGKNGSTINQIRQESGARVKISDAVPECDETEIIVSASEFIDDRTSSTIEALLQLQGRTTPRSDADGIITTRLLVPSNQIGCLIGKGGNIVSEMRKTSRADIRIMSKENLPKCASENDELVQISGEVSFARDALIQIASRLRAKALQETDGSSKAGLTTSKSTLAKIDGGAMTSHYTRHDLFATGATYQSSALGYTTAGGRQSTAVNYNSFGTYPFGGSSYDYIQGYTGAQPSDSGFSSGPLNSLSSASSLEVTVPKDAVGVVLGKRGGNLQHIREISGAKIKLHDPRPGTSDQVVEISGTAEQTHAARSLLQAFVASGQNQNTYGGARVY